MDLQTETSQASSKGHVMLVDDDDSVRRLSERVLRRLGYDLTVCSSGRTAIDFYKEHADEVNLVVLDMVMPDMGGRATFVELKRINPNVRVVLASGYAVDEEASECVDEGALEFVRKPFMIEDLQRVVETHVIR